ncbi:MAG: minichromosome maintenance protein MCM [Candidatus Micrarchaeota archaeon]
MAEDLTPLINEFEEFFELKYKLEIEKLAAAYPTKRSLEVNYRELEKYSIELADELRNQPDKIIEAAEKTVAGMSVLKMPGVKFEPHIRFFNLPDDDLLIQDVGAAQIEKLVQLRGIISKRAEVRPKVKVAFYRCSYCDSVYKVPITKKTKAVELCDSCKRRSLKLVEEESYFVDIQRAEAQELLERLQGGAPTSHIELLLEDDLVNSLIPGDTVELSGILRIKPPLKGKGVDTYSKYIDIVHVQKVQREFEEVVINKEDEQRITELSRDPRVHEKFVASFAPSIYGHEEVKEAIILQLFGGTPEKVLPDGGKIRNDIHILLIGDPGSAKTRFLQYVTELAPKSIYVSGKSVTGVGLTAAAEKDELGDGGWVLKAGALVLASGGLAGVDEFDKISDQERAALHEVMESQSVSVAKAGIVAKFKAKTAILAAANPKFGRFDPNQPPGQQFDIPGTLLSRFDLIFPIRDVMDEEKDKSLAEHMLRSHQVASMHIKEKNDTEKEDESKRIPRELIRKYISYARKNCKPELMREAMDKIKEYYVELRKVGASQHAVPITPRQVEGIIRLSEASAKIRLSQKVEIVDAERAIKLLDFVLRQVMMDRETQRIDIDIIATGRSKSTVDKYNNILNIVREMSKDVDMIEKQRIVDEARNYDIDEGFVRKFIDDRLRQGEFYEPQPGFIKLVKRFD